MRTLKLSIFAIAAVGMTACGGTFRPTNVAGTWSCPLINGVCADVAAIDEATRARGTAIPVNLSGALESGATSNLVQTGSVITSSAPRRTDDEVARIVFAPKLDQNGDLHGSQVIYSVMKKGAWKTTAPVPRQKPSKTDQEAAQRKAPLRPEAINGKADRSAHVVKTKENRHDL